MRDKIARFFLILPALACMAFIQPEENINFVDIVIDYQFGEQVTFEAQIQSALPVEQISRIDLYIDAGNGEPLVENVQFDELGRIRHTTSLAEVSWMPFVTVRFRFHTLMVSGQQFTSETYSFHYADNRLEWRSLSNPPFTVSWHSDDNQLGSMILQTAFAGLQSAAVYTGAEPTEEIWIYAYSDPEALRTALGLENLSLLAGHANTKQRIILISTLPGPGQQLELERQLPHEIAHILLEEISADSETLPAWLVEGLATASELYPNPDYQRILNAAASSGGLIPMDSLCTAFSDNPTAAYLSYAQSGSFVNFIYRRFGTAGLASLIQRYSEGISCQNGMEKALGETLDELEYRWQMEVLGLNSGYHVFQNLSPYLALFAVLWLVPVTPFLFRRKNKVRTD